mmetsp:Transcript_16146/g.37078  ORF Transcript_16146/g.37078 Transcript_16146/m.37078 type:complete len:83 (-) Transcript_16146:391-639(-)
MGIIANPFALIGFVCEAFNRIKSKEIGGDLKGEGVTQGGLIFLDADGEPVYAYEEQTGRDLPVMDIMAVVHQMRRDAATDAK